MTVFGAQLGFAEESTYGTPVTVTKFFEFNSESFVKEMGRVESSGHRSGQRVMRSDRFEPFVRGVTGSVNMDVPTKGFGILLKHWLGSSSISTATDSNYTQTHIVGDLTSRYLTGQVNRELQDGTDQAHTLHGLKVTSGELAMDAEGVLVATFDFDGEDEDTATSLASASYASDTRVFSFAGASAQIASSSIELKSIKVRVQNPLNVDRRYIRSSALKKNPLENGQRLITWEVVMDHTALTQYNRVMSSTRASALAELKATFDGPIAHGGSTLPRLEVTIPAARFDAVSGLNVASRDELTTTFTGVGLYDGSNEPITITYRTTDSAVV